MDEAPLLAIRGLAAGYGGAAVIDGLDLTLRRGEVLGLLGANGSGKSTLLRAVTGQLRLLAGSVTIDGVDLATMPERAKAGFGFAIDPADLPEPLTGRQYLELVASIRGATDDDPAIADGIARLALGRWLDRPIAGFSLGTCAKLSIVAALIGAPPLLILDESLNGLDPVAAFEVKRLLLERVRSGRHAAIVSTHVVEIVPTLCSRAVLMDEGRLVRSWSAPELERAGSGFEAEVMAALRALPEVAGAG